MSIINLNYKQFAKTINEQRRRLRDTVGKIDTEMADDISSIYLPTLIEDVHAAVPRDSGVLEDTGLSFKFSHTQAGLITITASAKAYSHQGYNYAYIQHENVTYSHTKGTHHYLSAPFEKMIEDIAGDYGLPYKPPADAASVYGNKKGYLGWASGVEGAGE